MSRREARRAKYVTVMICAGGDVHVRLHDAKQRCFAESIMEPAAALALCNDVLDQLQSFVEDGGEVALPTVQ